MFSFLLRFHVHLLFLVVLSRLLAQESHELCHLETGRQKRGMELYNWLLLLKICPIGEPFGDQKSNNCHWSFVINVVRGLCYAATQ
jgi:hypothetical protein